MGQSYKVNGTITHGQVGTNGERTNWPLRKGHEFDPAEIGMSKETVDKLLAKKVIEKGGSGEKPVGEKPKGVKAPAAAQPTKT